MLMAEGVPSHCLPLPNIDNLCAEFLPIVSITSDAAIPYGS